MTLATAPTWSVPASSSTTASGTQGNFAEEKKVTFNEEYTVKAGDELIFAIDSDGNDSYDGGRLAVTISDENGEGEPEEPETPEEPEEPDTERTNNTVLKDDFSSEQGKNGWYYGMCEWDSKNFSELTYDADNNRYYNKGKPELKADFVEPGGGKNAAYKWVAAEDGTIRVSGEYTKFANSADADADGTCMRIFVNGNEKKWLGAIGNYSDEQKVTFDEEYTVKAGDELIFAVNPEGNDSYDGGRLSVTISDKKSKSKAKKVERKSQEKPKKAPAEEPAEAPADEPEKAPAEEPEKAPAEEPEKAPAEEPEKAPEEKPEEKPEEQSEEKSEESIEG